MSPFHLNSIQLFLDLDGVLVDFDLGVKKVTGKLPQQLKVKTMWSALARTPDFFANLPWTADGQYLWNKTKALNPIILTGLPLGKWAEPQKRTWCTRELGADIPVITCLSREKSKKASQVITAGTTAILIDDRPHYKDLWIDQGGIFITHVSTQDSLQQLQALLMTDLGLK